MKKYKEYRITMVLSIVIVIMLLLSFYIGYKGNFARMSLGLIISVLAMFMVSLGYNITLEEDYIIIHQWKILMLVPKMIDFKDIRRIYIENKHCVKIDTLDKVYNCYVFDSEKFYNDFKLLRSAYINAKKKHKK